MIYTLMSIHLFAHATTSAGDADLRHHKWVSNGGRGKCDPLTGAGGYKLRHLLPTVLFWRF